MCTVSSSREAISSYVLLRPSRSARATSSTESRRTNPGCLSTRSAGWCCGWGPAPRCGSESAETDRSSGRGCWVGREPPSWPLISQSGACSTAGSTRGVRTSSPPPRSSLLPPLLCASHRRNPTRILGRPLVSACPPAELVPIPHPGLPLTSTQTCRLRKGGNGDNRRAAVSAGPRSLNAFLNANFNAGNRDSAGWARFPAATDVLPCLAVQIFSTTSRRLRRTK